MSSRIIYLRDNGEIMKNILLITGMLFSVQLFAADPPVSAEKSEAVCKEEAKSKYALKASPVSEQGQGGQYPGTNSFRNCEKLSRGWIRQIYGKNGSRRDDFKWAPYIDYACAEAGKCPGSKDYEDCRKLEEKKAIACESVLHAMSFYDRDWSDQEMITEQSGKAAAPAAGGQQQQQAGAASVAASTSSIKCQSAGIETVDFIPCRKFQVQLELIDAVQGIAYGTQQIVYQEKISDAQSKYVNEENTATGALKATRDSLKMQQDMYQQRTAVDATKLAYLVSVYNEVPKSDEVLAKCERLTSKDGDSMGLRAPIEKESCKAAVLAGRGGFALNMNGAQMDAMKAKLVQIAAQAGSSMLLSSLLGKRAKDVDNAIAKIDAFKPLDPYVVSEEDEASTFCKQNPGLAQCLTGGLERTFDQINDNVITFGDSGPATNYAGANGNTDGLGSGETSTTPDATSTKPMGSIISSAVQDNSIEDSNAAKVTTTGAGSKGGGGGGGGGGSAGGGGGGAPPTQGAGSAPVNLAKAPTYGGGSGSIAMMGGFGINKPKSDAKVEDNPFGKLFGKDNKGPGVVNFRDPASNKVGGKDDNLFDMITNRYKSVSADKRLIEYELAK